MNEAWLLMNKKGYLTHVFTDKPIYKPKDNVYFGFYIVGSDDQSVECNFFPTPFNANFKIYNPKDEVVIEETIPLNSFHSHSWYIPENISGGEYKIVVDFKDDNSSNYLSKPCSGERKFQIRNFQNNKFNTQIEFLKKGYSEGEKASAKLNVKRAEGGIPEGSKVDFTVRIDGKSAAQGSTVLDKKGNGEIEFTLPKEIENENGTLSCIISDKGIVENASKTIPIILHKMNVKFYPEGGTLVSNLECGLYFESKTNYGEPADFVGDIVNSNGKVITSISTEHEGRGKTTFKPLENEKYALKVNFPSGIKKLIALPEIEQNGVSLLSCKNFYEPDELINLQFSSTTPEEYSVHVFKRDKELSSFKVNIQEKHLPKQLQLSLPSTSNADGVLRVSVLNSEQKPVAERLIFRNTKREMNIKISSDYKNYSPGETAKISISTTDEKGNGVQSQLSIIVTDQSVLEKIEKRKKAPRILPMIYLEQEVELLEDANHYIIQEPDTKSKTAIDLLLGVQGWRRYLFKDLEFGKDSKYDRIYGKTDSIDNTKIMKSILKKQSSAQFLFNARQPKNTSFMDNQNNNNNVFGGSTATDFLSFGGTNNQIQGSGFGFESTTQSQTQRSGFGFSNSNAGFGSSNSNVGFGFSDSNTGFGSSNSNTGFSFGSQNVNHQSQQQQSNYFGSSDNFGYSQPNSQRNTSDDTFISQNNSNTMNDVFGTINYTSSNSYSQNPNRPSNFGFGHHKFPNIEKYQHTKQKKININERIDFQETLYWKVNFMTSEDGTGEFTFDLPDSITSFKIMVDGFSLDSVFGSSEKSIENKNPFYIDFKIPHQLTCGDKIDLPVNVMNSTPENLKSIVTPRFPTQFQYEQQSSKFDIQSDEGKRLLIPLCAKQTGNDISVTVEASAGPFEDKITRTTKIIPIGFPYENLNSGVLEKNQNIISSVDIPKEILQNTSKTSITLYPTVSSNLKSATKKLMKSPYGCFEQVSATNYPLVLAYKYMKKTGNLSELSKSKTLIEEAYKKMIKFECESGGFEWFGYGDGLESLTALGLLQFSEMKDIIDVDENMLSRTLKWILNRKQKNGGFKLNQSKNYQMSYGKISQSTIDAYIYWALTESNIVGLDNDISFINDHLVTLDDPYVIALAGISLFNLGEEKLGNVALEKLEKFQLKEGEVKGKISITGSGGSSLIVETTSLCLLAWMKNQTKFMSNIVNGFKWIHMNCKDGAFGSTQATALALKAIVKFDSFQSKSTEKVIVEISGVFKREFSILPNEMNSIQFSVDLKPGKYDLMFVSTREIPYSIKTEYSSLVPNSNKECEVHLTTKLSEIIINEGSSTEINVTLQNHSKESQTMTIAIIGIPSGLELRHEKLTELKKAEVFDFYEIVGGNLFVYWRGMKPNQLIKFNLDVIAIVPGEFTGEASRCYLYYTDEYKEWIAGLKCKIVAKDTMKEKIQKVEIDFFKPSQLNLKDETSSDQKKSIFDFF
eukprot:gene11545-4798_t